MSSQARIRWHAGRWRNAARSGAMALLLFVVATLALAGCSSTGSSKGIDYTLGLQGSTADNPAQPPKIAASGPDGEYAFVYDNQVWAHVKGATSAVQITRLTLSNGATIMWGPLVWSPSGHSLAFAVVHNMATDQPTRTAGAIYYVNVSTCLTTSGAACPVYTTEATGSVYGHSYAWLNDDWLITGGNSGIAAFDISDPNGWRTWQLRVTANEQQDANCGQARSYGDVQVVGTTLYYTCTNLSSLDSSGAIGTATLNASNLSSIVSQFGNDAQTRDEQIATILNGDSLYGYQVAGLGNVYLDAVGNVVAGAWKVSGTTLVYERVGNVDTKNATAGRAICSTSVYNYGGCDQSHTPSVKSQPLTAHPLIALGPNGAIAYQGDKLYVSGQNSSIPVTSTYAPMWVTSSDVAATSILSTTTDASGVTRESANLIIVSGGAPSTLIVGASDLAWR